MGISSPGDGMDGRRRRQQRIVEAMIELLVGNGGEGLSRGNMEAIRILKFGATEKTFWTMVYELKTAGAVREDKDGWHTTQKSRELFK